MHWPRCSTSWSGRRPARAADRPRRRRARPPRGSSRARAAPPPGSGTRFRGQVVVHDCEAEDLRALEVDGRIHRINPAVIDTDLVVTVGAGETVLHGGATALLDACAAGTIRSSKAVSLLEPGSATGWRLASTLEIGARRTAPVIGVSLVLDRPRTTGLHRGYPWSAEGRRALARSPFRRLLNLSPAAVRRRVLAGISRELNVVAALAGPPTVAHAEALVRGASVRSVTVPRQFDTIVVPASLGRTAPATRAPQPDHRRRPGPRSRAPPLA